MNSYILDSWGDMVYCLPMMFELSEKTDFDISLHIQTNVKSGLAFEHPNGDVRMTRKNAEFLLPLMESLNLFTEVTYGDETPGQKEDQIIIDLGKAYSLPINYMAGNIELWPYNLINLHLPQDLSKPRIFADPDPRSNGKLILMRSQRYNNILIDFGILEKYKDRIIFLGTEPEHNEFEKKYFNVEYIRLNSALEFAQLAGGSMGVISNQNGLYSIAEIMKVSRILLTCEFIELKDNKFFGPVNVHPARGWFEVAQTQEKFECSLQNLLNNFKP